MAVGIALPTAQSLMGGYLIEMFFAIFLYGISVAQTYVYVRNCSRDTMVLKAIVATVMFIETIHSIFSIHTVYHYTINEFGQILEVLQIVWSSGICVISGIMVISLVQTFYVRRIWILSNGNKFLTGIPAIFLFFRIGFGFGTGVLTYKMHTWPRFRAQAGPMFTLSAGVGFSATVDLLIALILIYHLRKSRTGFKQTDHVLESLMIYAVNTGAVTTISSIAVVFIFVFKKDSLLFAGLWLMTSKLYANSLLGTLNTRQAFRKASAFSTSELSGRVQQSSQMRPIEIFQESSKVTDADSFPMAALTNNHEREQPKIAELA